jgi:hypothetical protein
MIKPGTICIVVICGTDPSLVGRFATVTAPLEIRFNGHDFRRYYPTDIVCPREGLPCWFEIGCLKPTDDPDHYARDPAWTKRPEKAPA